MTGDAIACTSEQNLLGEGARWDARRDELLRVDILAGRVYRDRIADDGSLIRESVELTNDARRDIPSTLICTGFTAEQYQTYAREHPDWAFLAGVPELRNATWVDLPTSHWPMWSRPQELARIIGDVAKAHSRAGVATSA